jgi:hypothetical protein
MINRQVGQWFGSNIFRFVGSGGMMGASNFTGQPNEAPSAGAPSTAAEGLYANAVLDAAPVAYWRLTELYGYQSYDVMRAHDGTYEKGVVQGKTGLISEDEEYAAAFDGVSAIVAIASAPELGNEHTVECWVNCSSSVSNAGILSEEYVGGANPICYSLGINQTTGGGGTATLMQGGYYTGSDWEQAEYGQPFPLNKILHTLYVKDASNIRLYMNAIEVGATTTTASAPVTSGDQLRIGQRHDTGASFDFFHGIIDEVALYGKALTEAEIREHYAIGIGHTIGSYPYRVITDGAIGYYRMSEASGTECSTTVNDPDYWAGTYQNTPTLGVTPIIVGDAATNGVRLDGVNEHITVSQVFDQIETNNQYTLETWVIASSSTPGAALIATAYPAVGDVTFALMYGGAGSETRLETGFYDGTTWFDCINDYPTPLNTHR